MTGPRTRRGRVVVGYDGSADADLALSWALDAAHADPAGQLDVLVVADTGALPPPAPEDPDAFFERVAARATGLVDRVGGQVRTDVRIVRGVVTITLLDAARDADLLVVGSRGHGAVYDAVVGSVSQHVAPRASCPVAVVRPTAGPRTSHVVVGVDGSPASRRALALACERAEAVGARVTAVRAWPFRDLPVDTGGDVPPWVGARIEEERRLLAEDLAGVRTDHPDLDVRADVVGAEPTTALVEASSGADLVVVGSRGRGAVTGLVLGSVSRGVLHRARCPVLVTR